jgi:hypothetical protein
MTRSLRFRLSLFLLATLLAMPAVAASTRGAQETSAGVFSSWWGFLESLIPARRGVHTASASRGSGESSRTATGCDLGSVMDPNGCPGHNQTTGGSPDLGSVMDPNG